ncbi:glycoside hydrolase family 13 protein [Pleomassaria siparia CBS 279.74]|uniref:alpha-amylase n=1 Tax=Pleomassaria siparia CBS 279.74 TaxID=1314801 RepID=A0A6G1K5G0_9PLEO|nr:glycoside hydrolase family 13 protein [Pleomassaria siparia CBS 279.74]
MKIVIFACATVAWLVASAGVVQAATAEQWRSRSIYQLLTDRFARTDESTTAPCNVADGDFCGGTWRGIIGQLDYIQDMGFTAIWISPITYNLPERTAYGYAYHGYWQQDLYRLNDHFGTADDLKALSQALHDRNMYLMVDVVTNHNGWNGSADTVDYSRFHPFDDAKYYHPYCPITDYDNQTMVEDCWLGDPRVELPDLRTEDQAVADGYNYWIHELVSNYSIDGLRLDTCKHVGKPFLSSFNQASEVFCTGEVFSGNAQFTCEYQSSLDSILNLPLYYPIIDFLNSTSGTTAPLITALSDIRSSCKDVSVLGTFTESHDLPRFASQTQDMSLAKNALALTVLWDGIPIVYAGQEQHYDGYGDPGNREATWLAQYSREGELYKVLAAVNEVRNRALAVDAAYATYGVNVLYSDTNTLAMRKGFDGKQVVSVFTNNGASAYSYTLNLANTGWASGTAVVEILSCAQVIVAGDGTLPVAMEGGLPRVYFSNEAATGSGICQGTVTPTTTADKTQSGVNVTRSAKGRRRQRRAAIAMAAAAAGATG